MAGGASVIGTEQITYTTSMCLRPLMVRVWRTCRTRAAQGKPIHTGAAMALIVRRTRRPWLWLLVLVAGISFHGWDLSLACSAGVK